MARVKLLCCFRVIYISFSIIFQIPNASNPGGSDACQAVEDIFSTKYLPTLILGILAMWSSIFVVVTLCDQLRNVALNISINERVNWKRYIWLRTPVNGKFFNWYDRGFWCNCMEFWKLDERGRCRVSEREGKKDPTYTYILTYLHGYVVLIKQNTI